MVKSRELKYGALIVLRIVYLAFARWGFSAMWLAFYLFMGLALQCMRWLGIGGEWVSLAGPWLHLLGNIALLIFVGYVMKKSGK